MRPTFIGIAGGSGAGKSTLAFGLWDSYPEKIALVHLDDYFKKREEFPILDGLANAEHPSVIRFDDLVNDLTALRDGKPITVRTKSERLNPQYKKVGKIAVVIEPKPIIIVEGYLALFDERIRSFFSSSFFLDLEHDTRYNRRTHFKLPAYEEKVLKPMHSFYVEPTKSLANTVINLSELTKEEVLDQVKIILRKQEILS